MRLISLDLNNFRQHKDTRLEFMPGVTGIIGKNGSGKTTILEAIAWALYGSAAIRGKNEHIRSRAAEGKSPVEVTLAFGLGPHTYTVVRRLDPTGGRTSANLSIDGLPARTGFKEVTEAVIKLLGMDYHAFFTSFFTAQKELEFMRGLDGRQRAAAVSRMLGYERLVKAREQANQDRLGLQREIEGLERGLPDPEDIERRKAEAGSAVKAAEESLKTAERSVKAAVRELERLKPLRELSEQKAKRVDELTRRIELDKAEVKRASDRIKSLEAELADISTKEKELESLAPQLEENRKASEEYHELAGMQKYETRRAEIQGQLARIEEDQKILEARLKKLAESPEAAVEVEKELADLSRQISEIEERIGKEQNRILSERHRITAEIEQLRAQIAEITQKKNAIVTAGPAGKCPTCERPLTGELPKVLAGFDEQIQRLNTRIAKLEGSLTKLEKEPESLAALTTLRQALEAKRQAKIEERAAVLSRKTELAACESESTTKRGLAAQLRSELAKLPSGFDQQRFDALREVGEKLKPIRERSITLKAAVGRYPGLQNDLEKEQQALEKAGREVESAEKALREMEFSQDEHISILSEFERARSTSNEAGLIAERARGDLRAAQASLAAAVNDEKSYNEKESELRGKKRVRLHLQTLADALDKLRNDLNNRTAPDLAAAASELLSEMTDGRYNTIEVDEDYQAIIRDDGELKHVISGGEDDIVNLSLRLAVSKMIADRAGQDLDLLVLDEVFGSLDDIRRDNVVKLLQTLKARFEQIIVITHVESIHDAVDNCIWVDYDEAAKVSRVRTQQMNEYAALEGASIL